LGKIDLRDKKDAKNNYEVAQHSILVFAKTIKIESQYKIVIKIKLSKLSFKNKSSESKNL
jgi:hypothetical protein